MTEPFFAHLLHQVTGALRAGVAVVTDPAAAFTPFFDELTGAVAWDSAHPDTALVEVAGTRVRFARFDGSWFALKGAIEPFLSAKPRPSPPLLLYIPAPLPDDARLVLAEAILAGKRLDWTLDREARACLRQRHTEGVIDEVLAGGTATYDDIVRFLSQGGRTVSKLRAIFPGRSDTDILLAWLVDPGHDTPLTTKGATEELRKLVLSRLGLDTPPETTLPALRSRVSRAVLLAEFLSDLSGAPPDALAAQPRPTAAPHVTEALELARAFRERHGDTYAARADTAADELRVGQATIDPSRLGRVDTFRFEEQRLLDWCAGLLVERRYADVMEAVAARGSSFWVERDLARKAQWELCRRVAELGLRLAFVSKDLPTGAGPAEWVRRYAGPEGWHELDRAQRALETFRAQMADDGACEQAAAQVLRAHEVLLQKMAEQFSAALVAAKWQVPDILPQGRIWADAVAGKRGPVAYIWVDAMRYEMGAELARLLDGADELHLRPAVAALPTITPVGMAALLPGAAARFSVDSRAGKLVAVVDDNPVADSREREKHVKARVPEAVELTLPQALQLRAAELKARVSGRSLVVVRSQEIDEMGEKGGDWLARRAMAEVLGDLARAVRKLSRAGVEHFVITADHGHLFGLRKGDDMKTDAPGGETVELHRRCWIGRGGTNPPGTVRVSAHQLGYASNLDFVFPTGLGVFKAGGDLSFHHGSTSLQELVVPVLTFRLPPPPDATATTDAGPRPTVRLLDVPDAITNRFLSVRVDVTAHTLFATEAVKVRVVLLDGEAQAGRALMSDIPEFDAATGVVSVKPGAQARLGVNLTRDDAASVRIVALDPDTGATLAQSGVLPVSLMR
jgi:hypothetical protein